MSFAIKLLIDTSPIAYVASLALIIAVCTHRLRSRQIRKELRKQGRPSDDEKAVLFVNGICTVGFVLIPAMFVTVEASEAWHRMKLRTAIAALNPNDLRLLVDGRRVAFSPEFRAALLSVTYAYRQHTSPRDSHVIELQGSDEAIRIRLDRHVRSKTIWRVVFDSGRGLDEIGSLESRFIDELFGAGTD